MNLIPIVKEVLVFLELLLVLLLVIIRKVLCYYNHYQNQNLFKLYIAVPEW